MQRPRRLLLAPVAPVALVLLASAGCVAPSDDPAPGPDPAVASGADTTADPVDPDAEARPAAPAEAAPAAAPLTLPVLTDSGYLVHEVWLGGEGPFWAVLDTGNQGTILFASVAGRLGLETAPLGEMGGAGPGSVPVEEATDVAVGMRGEDGAELVWTEPRVTVLPDAYALPPIEGRRIDAFLGATLLREHLVTIDYPAGRLTLSPREGWEPPADALVLAFELTAGFPHLGGTVTPLLRGEPVEPVTGRFLLDLGSPFPLELEHAEVAARGLLDGDDPARRAEGTAMGIDGVPMEILSGALGAVELGGAGVTGRPGFDRAILPTVAGGGPPIEGLVGSLGSAPFRGGRLTLDYAGGRAVYQEE